MGILAIIVDILDKVIWPIVILIIVLVFRGQIGRAIKALSKLKYKDFELEFKKDLDDAENKAKVLQLPPPEEIKKIPETVERISPYDRILQISEISARAAIAEAWRMVEFSTMNLAKSRVIDVKGHIAGINVIHKLVERNVLKPDVLYLYRELRNMRNMATHSSEFQIGPIEAARYVDLALSLANRLQMVSNES